MGKVPMLEKSSGVMPSHDGVIRQGIRSTDVERLVSVAVGYVALAATIGGVAFLVVSG